MFHPPYRSHLQYQPGFGEGSLRRSGLAPAILHLQVDRNIVKGKGGRSVQAIDIDIEDGKVTLLVFGDINSTKPTHEIDMGGAQEANRAKVKQEVATEPVVVSIPAGYTAASTPDVFVIPPQHIGLFKKNHIPTSETFLPPVDPNGVS